MAQGVEAFLCRFFSKRPQKDIRVIFQLRKASKFTLGLAVLVSSIALASGPIRGWPTSAAFAIEGNVEVLQTEQGLLYNSCKESLEKNTLFDSYCADVIRGMLAGYSLITQAFPPAINNECSEEITEALHRQKWLLSLDNITLEGMAKSYVSWVKLKKGRLDELKAVLASPDEIDMASAIISEYSEGEKKIGLYVANQSIDSMLRLPNSKDAASLYESCSASEEALQSYCNGTISGIWIGYGIAYQGVLKPLVKGKCTGVVEKSVLKGFKDRYLLGPACYASKRKSHEVVRNAYLSRINEMSPEKIMRLGKEAPYFEMIRVIEETCEN